MHDAAIFWGFLLRPAAGAKEAPGEGPLDPPPALLWSIGAFRACGARPGALPLDPARFFVKKAGQKTFTLWLCGGGRVSSMVPRSSVRRRVMPRPPKAHDLLVRVAVAVVRAAAGDGKAGARKTRISSSVELELPWWPSLSTSQLRSKPPSAAQSASAPEEMSPVKSMALPPYSTRRTRLESFKSSLQSETGPTNWNSAPPRVKTLPRGGTVMYRPRPPPCPQSA